MKSEEIKVWTGQWEHDELKSLHEKKDPKNEKLISEGIYPELFENKDENDRQKIDYIITLGGDGTILWAAKQFFGPRIPPLICFYHGSLGYLCNFKMENYQKVLEEILNDKCKLVLDGRLRL